MKSRGASGLRARSAGRPAGLEGPREGVRVLPLGQHSEEPHAGTQREVAAGGALAEPAGLRTGASPGRALEARRHSPGSPA